MRRADGAHEPLGARQCVEPCAVPCEHAFSHTPRPHAPTGPLLIRRLVVARPRAQSQRGCGTALLLLLQGCLLTPAGLASRPVLAVQRGCQHRCVQPLRRGSHAAARGECARRALLRRSRLRLPHFRLPHFRLPHFRLPHLRLPHLRLPHLRLPHLRLPHLRLPRLRCPHPHGLGHGRRRRRETLERARRQASRLEVRSQASRALDQASRSLPALVESLALDHDGLYHRCPHRVYRRGVYRRRLDERGLAW
eukprot:scaffold64736_cov53-Phaeocystis_antarctica.AAC.1